MGSSDTNWQDVLYNDNAPVQNHQLSISGASEKFNYYLSLGYYKSEACDRWRLWTCQLRAYDNKK